MALVPVGKRLIMKAQSYPAPGGDPQAVEPDLGVSPNDVQEFAGAGQEVMEPGQEEAVEPVVEDESDEANLSKIVFQFLAGIGYPPRRLQEFKSDFYEERGSKMGDTQVILTLPDQLYGSDGQIPKSKLKLLVEEIENSSGLSYIDYKRANLKIIMNFSSASPQDEEKLDGAGDILDQVYGKPKGSGGKKKMTAMTTKELIKTNKNKMVDMLLALLKVGDKDASTSR